MSLTHYSVTHITFVYSSYIYSEDINSINIFFPIVSSFGYSVLSFLYELCVTTSFGLTKVFAVFLSYT